MMSLLGPTARCNESMIAYRAITRGPHDHMKQVKAPTCLMMSLLGPTARGCIESMVASRAEGGRPSNSRLLAMAFSGVGGEGGEGL